MGQRLRCSSVTYRFRYAPSSRALPTAILNATICQLHMRRGTGERRKSVHEVRIGY
jgi:hypothetical protein